MNQSGVKLLVKDLFVEADGKEILKGINLQIRDGEVHVLFGPNGSGKSSLLLAIMGSPKYQVTHGKIYFNGKDITELPTYERAKLGIGLALQHPPQVKGVKLRKLLEFINNKQIEELAEELQLKEHLERGVNVGFSGGEAKRSELLQLMVQSPSLILLDEPESGVDLENMALVGKILEKLLKRYPIRGRHVSGLIITHTGYVLDYITADVGHVMLDGRIICTGNPYDILITIREHGFLPCTECWKKELQNAKKGQ